MKRPARVPSHLSESLHKRLSAYVLAASAAGAGMLALAQPAEARIVSRRIDVALCGLENYPFYPAGLTGKPTFNFWGAFDYRSSRSGYSFVAEGFSGNSEGASAVLAPNGSVASLRQGSLVGSGRTFGKGNSDGLLFTYHRFQGSKRHEGNFKFNQIDYLGFRFAIVAKQHFGWVRMRIRNRPNGLCRAVEHLIDYAYETIPNKPIKAGQTHGKDDSTLGRLAQGASGISSWRQNK